MAIFGSKKNTKVEKKPEHTAEQTTAISTQTKNETKKHVSRPATNLSGLIMRPRITEKASDLSASNAYAFEVADHATKAAVSAAITELYNVVPVKVAILKIPTKQVIIQNKRGVKRGGKKAYVYLQKGQTIELT